MEGERGEGKWHEEEEEDEKEEDDDAEGERKGQRAAGKMRLDGQKGAWYNFPLHCRCSGKFTRRSSTRNIKKKS